MKNLSVQNKYARFADESVNPNEWRGLVGAWPFSVQGSGNRIHDFSRYPNIGSVNGTYTWEPGKFGRTLNFDGLSVNVDIGSNVIDATQDVTMCAWINIASAVYYSGIMVQSADFNEASVTYGMYMFDTTRRLKMAIGGTTVSAYSTAIPLSTWTHVAITNNATESIMYVNGVGESAASLAAPSSSGSSFHIGSFTSSSAFFDGLIDDVRVYNRSLSESEILNIYGEMKLSPWIKQKKVNGFTVAGGVIFPPNSLALTGAGR